MLPPSTAPPRPRALGHPPVPSFHRRAMSMYLPNDHLDVPSIQIDSPPRPSLYTTFSGDEGLSLLASNPKWKLKRHLPDLGNKQPKRRSLATAAVMGWLEDVEPPQPAQKVTFGRLPRSPAFQTSWLHPLTDEHLEKARKDRRQPRRPRHHQPEIVRSNYSKVFDHAPQSEIERVAEVERPKHTRGLLGSLKHGLSKSISFRTGLATKESSVVKEAIRHPSPLGASPKKISHRARTASLFSLSGLLNPGSRSKDDGLRQETPKKTHAKVAFDESVKSSSGPRYNGIGKGRPSAMSIHIPDLHSDESEGEEKQHLTLKWNAPAPEPQEHTCTLCGKHGRPRPASAASSNDTDAPSSPRQYVESLFYAVEERLSSSRNTSGSTLVHGKTRRRFSSPAILDESILLASAPVLLVPASSVQPSIPLDVLTYEHYDAWNETEAYYEIMDRSARFVIAKRRGRMPSETAYGGVTWA